MFAPIAQAGAFFNPYQASSSYLPLTAPTPLPTPSFYSSAPTAVPLPLAAPTPAPAQYDYSNSNVIANPHSADMYRYPNSSKNFPSYKYEEITFELPQDYYSNNQPTTYTVRDYSSSNVAGNSTSTTSTSNGGNQSTPAQNGSHQSRPPSTRPLSRNQARSMTPFGSVAMTAAPQQGGNEAQRSFTPNPFHLQSTAPTPLPDASLRKMRKSRLQSRFQNSTPTIMNCYQHQPDSFTSASNLNMNGRAKTPANQGGQYSIQQSEYYMNAYSAQAAANQGQQNNGSQTPAPNGHVANEYLSKPPIYYNTFNSINNANNVQNNANTNKNMMGYNSGRCSVVMDPLNPPKIQQRAPSSLTLNNGQVQQMQQQQAPQPQPRQQQQQQQQGYDNSSADQISYFDSPVTPTPSIYNPNLKTSDSGRLSRRQKATPSTVHFASPLVTPIPYALDGNVRYDVKENIDPMLDAECKRHRMLKETRSHSTIPTYRPQPLTPVNYSFETSRGISDSKMKKYRPNTPGSMTLHRDGLMADPSQLLNMQQQQQLQQQHQSRKMCTPGGITATTPTPLHMLMMTNNQTPHPHGHHHHHHRHHHHSHHHRSHNGANNNTPTYPHSQSSSATNNGVSNQNGNNNSNFIRLCYLKPNSNEFECKNIQIRDDGSGGGVGNSGGNGGGGNEYGANFGCSLEDLKKKKKMKFLGVFKEAPSSASYDTMDSWITNTRPESRLKYQDNDPKKRVNIAISNPAINNSHHGGNNASNNNMYMNHQVKFSPPQKSDSIINDYGGGQSVDSNDSSFGFDEFGGGGVTSADEAVTIMPMNGYSTGNASSKKLDLLSGLKPSNSREKLYKLIKDANGLVLLKEIS